MRISTVKSSVTTLTSIPCNTVGKKSQSPKAKQTQNSSKLCSSGFFSQHTKLDSKKFGSAGGISGVWKQRTIVSCRSKGTATKKTLPSCNTSLAGVQLKPFRKDLTALKFIQGGKRAAIHQKVVQETRVLLTKKDKSGCSVKKSLYSALTKYWNQTGPKAKKLSYAQFSKAFDKALKTKVHWRSNHYFNGLKIQNLKQYQYVSTVFKQMKSNVIAALETGSNTPRIFIRDGGIRHSRGLKGTMAKMYLSAFFHTSGAVKSRADQKNIMRKVGL